MSTRFKSDSKNNYGISPLPTGYEKSFDVPDFSIPSCGIEDVDSSLFNLFEKEISPESGGNNSSPVKKVPVIFAAGEKWAMLKNGRPLRDRNNTLILPLITIMRTELNQTLTEDVAGRGINQQTGEIVIKRRLDKSDRNYQSLINRLLLPNQDNLAVNRSSAQNEDSLVTARSLGQLATDKDIVSGAYLKNNRTNNVYETIVVPTPQFYTAKYQVTIWSQYTQHSNQILEKIFSSFLPQAQSWRLNTPKGYWFVAKIEDGSLSTETNFDDMSQQERFIKHSFVVTVPAYFFVSDSPGTPVPLKRYVSSPEIKFETEPANTSEPSLTQNANGSEYELGDDDPTLPLDEQKNNRADQRSVGWRTQKVYPALVDQNDPSLSNDPAALNLPRGYLTRKSNKSIMGETVYSNSTFGGLDYLVSKK